MYLYTKTYLDICKFIQVHLTYRHQSRFPSPVHKKALWRLSIASMIPEGRTEEAPHSGREQAWQWAPNWPRWGGHQWGESDLASLRGTRLLWHSSAWHGGGWPVGPTTGRSTNQRPNVTMGYVRRSQSTWEVHVTFWNNRSEVGMAEFIIVHFKVPQNWNWHMHNIRKKAHAICAAQLLRLFLHLFSAFVNTPLQYINTNTPLLQRKGRAMLLRAACHKENACLLVSFYLVSL
jgi:hypothetical protein